MKHKLIKSAVPTKFSTQHIQSESIPVTVASVFDTINVQKDKQILRNNKRSNSGYVPNKIPAKRIKFDMNTTPSTTTFSSRQTGISARLKHRVNAITHSYDKYCVVTFDEVSLAETLVYSQVTDKFRLDYVDLGHLGRQHILANHALVFMVTGIRESFKQPLAYYFTRDTIKASQLDLILSEVITSVQKIGLIPLAIVCDQASTNMRVVKVKCGEHSIKRPGPYFYENGFKIFTIFDPSHLLKNTRTTLANYDIKFCGNKIAKFNYIKETYERDKNRRFRLLHRIKDSYLDVRRNKNSFLKMKVSVAAKTLSQTVAAAIETMVSTGNNPLPAEAIQTAEFVHDVDSLFDSFNGRTLYPEKGKPYRCNIQNNSKHIMFWHNIKKISSWKFVPIDGGNTKMQLPCKTGWINNITAIAGIWETCQKAGMKHLRTRAFSQDPLENLFSIIRQHGCGNTKPSCFQFVASLKTSILNNMISIKSSNSNCEPDEHRLLDNLQHFLESEVLASPIIADENNEFLQICLPPFNAHGLHDSDSIQALAYVCGYLIRKMKNLDCTHCRSHVLDDGLKSYHIFTYFKEVDENIRLKYVTEYLIYYTAQIHDIIIYCLDVLGYIPYIKQKIMILLKRAVWFDWFQCNAHKDDVQSILITAIFNLTINKHFNDVKQDAIKMRYSKKQQAKVKKFRHVQK
ncbi:thap domain-containing protein 9 [Holotrichia oblita]|uniref:Thap domain-containing protein 9 n=1 Tax=Holotrichia oblita TaxID=644536 RepID=A0ACB9TJ09_HOLOL|nr:thap domain-containing protein 9 [Holotrichia oblita]